ncbi:MAG: cation-translocating P-type ATPase [Candidatus Woesearchaeota archaeon]
MHSGINHKEAAELLKKYGFNELQQSRDKIPIKILLRQIKTNPVIYLLLASLIISFVVGKITTAYVILGVILTVISVGFFQEFKAERSIEALRQMITLTSIVKRDNKEQEIETKYIVPGDIIILRTGDRVPADCIILEEKELQINESMLTGESKEVKKSAIKSISGTPHPENIVYMGTFIITGKCLVKAIHTGMNTKFGSIAKMISTVDKELPLQKKVNVLIKQLIILALVVSAFTGIIMLITGGALSYNTFVEVLVIVLALSIAAFPEGFPVVLIAALANGAYRMAKKNAIINRMSIIETLGETTIICADKTGTITTGQMTVNSVYINKKMLDIKLVDEKGHIEIYDNRKKIDLAKEHTLQKFLHTAVLCNDAKIERKEEYEHIVRGTPTESALMIFSAKLGLYVEDLDSKRIDEKPFSSERKMMSVIVKEKNAFAVYSKGAPDILLKECKYMMRDNTIVLLNDKERKKILYAVNSMSEKSLRTIALAYKDLRNISIKNVEKDLIFIGIAGIDDPPRPEVREAIEVCYTAGIKVKMITGDSAETARAVAEKIGLTGDILLGKDLDALTDDELSKVMEKTTIFARVRPEHKLRIVRALKMNGEIVTMTGDGVNDAPALKEAHIGVAMGKNGTDVSREVADMTLKDDHFATIVDAIREGRTIFTNIQKFAAYQISINIAQLLLIALSIIIGLPLPLLAIQILFMNILSDEVTAIGLVFNPSSKDIMIVPPRRKSEIITRPVLIFLLISGILMTVGAVGLFHIMMNVLNFELQEARTTIFVVMTLFAIFNAFNFRSFKKPVLTRSPFVNKYLFYAAIISILLTLLTVYSPLNRIFELTPVGWTAWMYALLLAILLVVIMDNIKRASNNYSWSKE